MTTVFSRSPNAWRHSQGPDVDQANGVMIAPSRQTVGRLDPSLSFQVQAPGARFFDVILATDVILFEAAQAHRRTARNFRSSRQDFLGEPIEVEAGFYLMPRVFLRDAISSDPRPERLYYLAAVYDDTGGANPRYSAPLTRPAEIPFVTLAGNLVAANLSKVMGVAVERLGRVAAGGQVVAALGLADLGGLPAQIGGLPMQRKVAPMARGAQTKDAPPGPLPPTPKQTDRPTQQPQPQTAQLSMPQRASGAGVAFVDEDYGIAVSGDERRPRGGWSDLDAGRPHLQNVPQPDDYDDGFGLTGTISPAASPPAAAQPAQDNRARAIPPLDPVQASIAPVPPTPTRTPTPTPTGSEEELVLQIIAEGAGGRYEGMNLDGGFRGRLGTNNPYYQRAHDGLRLGPHQALQDSGELGELLGLMQHADATQFAAIFGSQAQALLAMTNAPGPSGLEVPGGRGPRVQPLDGSDLWQAPWLDRFRVAAGHPAFQAAMRGQILARRLDPLRPIAQSIGLGGGRGLAMVLALAIHLGADGAIAHLRAAVNPASSPARLGAALDALGFVDLGAFCAAKGLPISDTVDDVTHFALIRALQALGPESPVQVADAQAFMDAIVTSAGPGALGDALLKLRLSTGFGDPEERQAGSNAE